MTEIYTYEPEQIAIEDIDLSFSGVRTTVKDLASEGYSLKVVFNRRYSSVARFIFFNKKNKIVFKVADVSFTENLSELLADFKNRYKLQEMVFSSSGSFRDISEIPDADMLMEMENRLTKRRTKKRRKKTTNVVDFMAIIKRIQGENGRGLRGCKLQSTAWGLGSGQSTGREQADSVTPTG